MKRVNMHFAKHEQYKGKTEYLRKNHLFLSYFKVLSELHCPQIPFYAFTGKKKKQENLHSNALGIIINPTAEKLTKNGSHLKEMWI